MITDNQAHPIKKSRNITQAAANDESEHPNDKDMLVIDTGGGRNATITTRAWKVLQRTNHRTAMHGYQDKGPPKVYPIVNAVTKVEIRGKDLPVLFAINYATLLDDPTENESLCVPFDLMRHGIHVDLTPATLGGTGGIKIEDQFLPFEFDNEKLFYNISKPTQDDLDTLEWFELTSPCPITTSRRNKKKILPEDIPIGEWRKRLAMLPEDVVRKTLDATTQFYMETEAENRQDPRRHLKSRMPGLRLPRQSETVASDTFFPSVTSDRGNTCSQFFVGTVSDRWEVYPLKTESHNGEALQDYTRKVGAPSTIKTDNAQSELGLTWTKHCRDQCINTETTEPHHPWQNPAESRIGSLSAMVRNVLRTFKAPLSKHDWAQKYCCDVHNHTASRQLNWRTPLEANEGHTPDISPFRFHFWEPIWYFDPKSKQPQTNLKKGRWLGIARSSGDAMTYYIETEKAKSEGRNTILIRSVIKTRRKNIGKEEEYVNDDPQYADFFLSEEEEQRTTEDDQVDPSDLVRGEVSQPNNQSDDDAPELSTRNDDKSDDEEDLEESLPPEEQGDSKMEELHDQFEMENDDDFEFERIVDHVYKDGVLILKVKFSGESDNVLDIPFSTLKKDVPLELAKYIREKVVESRRKGRYNTWALDFIKNHSRAVRRLYRVYNVDPPNKHGRQDCVPSNTSRSRRAKQNRMSKNARNAKIKHREKFGIRIPNNVREALLFDKLNGDTKWADAIAKEMGALERLHCFKFMPPNHKLSRKDGWQYAPLHMIFEIKQQDLRHKARFVVGGHVVDASQHITYSSTIQSLSVRLLMLVAVQNGLDLMAGDIGNAFPTAPCAEKVWSVAGPEFGQRQGAVVILQRALYGLKTSSRAFHEFLADLLRRMGFVPTRADQDLWYKRSEHYDGYDYIATHVDDLIIASKKPSDYMAQIEQEFLVRNIEDSPSYYLGNDIKRIKDKVHISSKKYVTEVLRRFQEKYGTLKKENNPMSPKIHPELDDSKLLDDAGVAQYQHIIGVCQWLVVAGRFDINFAVASLSRFSVAPREGHLELARKIMGYLKKYPKRGYTINPQPPKISGEYQEVQLKKDFGNQYHYFTEDIDPRFPEQLLPELDINIFCDSDHGHDKVTGRSITGLISFVGSTPVTWQSKRQSSVQTSTFGAEFVALKKAVEEAVEIRYHLRSMGVKVSKPTSIFVDNSGVVINASDPGSTLNKKCVALAYHFVREHAANSIVQIRKIDSTDNYADPFTKSLTSSDHHDFFYEIMRN